MLANFYTQKSWQLPKKFCSCRGVTLVELMVVVAILGVVMGAVYSLMLPVEKSTYTQTRVADVQDDLRLALQEMTRDVRHSSLLVSGDSIVNLNNNLPRQEFTVRLRIFPRALGARLVDYKPNGDPMSAPTDPVKLFRFDPSLTTVRFQNGQDVRIIDAANFEAGFSPAKINIADANGDDKNLNNLSRFDEDIVTFDTTISFKSNQDTYYVFPAAVGMPAVQTITYIFDPADNTLPGGPRPTLRRYENWPPDGTSIPAALPNPLPANWLLLGGDSRSDFVVNFPDIIDVVNKTNQFRIDITGRTAAYNPNKPDDSLGNVKSRRLQTTVALRNVVRTYE